jgi:hypothetical protein
LSFEPIQLAPAREAPEVYPYRRVWRTASIEVVLLLAVSAMLALIGRFVNLHLGANSRSLVCTFIAFLPLLFWLLISYRGERLAPLPRPRLLAVMMLGFLVANAIGIPLIDQVFQVEGWLSTASGLNRILGYTFTFGVVAEFLKYAVVRYSVWPSAIRIRNDGIAYAMAAAIGYTTALTISYILKFQGDLDPIAAMIHITGIALSQVAISTIMGYLLSELKISQPAPVFALPLGLAFAALLNGIYISVRSGLVVGVLSTSSTANSAFSGLGAAVFLVIALFVVINVIITNADERARLRGRPEE